MKNVKKTATLLTALFTLSILAVAIPVSAFPSEYGIWQPDPNSGTVEWTMDQAYSGDYSAYLMAKLAYTDGSDSNEVYIHSIDPEITTLNDLDSMSFYYYRPVTGDELPPQVDIWLDLDESFTLGPIPTGDDNWLLGQIPLQDPLEYDTWVSVPFGDIVWIKAIDGSPVYGAGSAGLDAAKAEINSGNYATLGDCPVIAIGVGVGSPATRDDTRIMEHQYYIDDIEINGVVYDFENVGKGPVSISGDARHPIVSISVDPTSIDFGEMVLGEYIDVANVRVYNTGETDVDLTAELMEDDGFYASSLYLDDYSVASWDKTLAEGANRLVDLELDIPRDADPGEHTAVLVFWAEEA